MGWYRSLDSFGQSLVNLAAFLAAVMVLVAARVLSLLYRQQRKQIQGRGETLADRFTVAGLQDGMFRCNDADRRKEDS